MNLVMDVTGTKRLILLDVPRLTFGNDFEGLMGVAADNCCHCGGGTSSATETPITETPATETTVQCTDTQDWVDSFGHGCDWYELSDEVLCPKLGESYEGFMGLAKDNCCHCGGGSLDVSKP